MEIKSLEAVNEILGTEYDSWENVARHQYLTEDFIREYIIELEIPIVITHQKLSEEFCGWLIDNWLCIYTKSMSMKYTIVDMIFSHQDLSEEFLYKYREYLSLEDVLVHKHVSEKFIENSIDNLREWRTIGFSSMSRSHMYRIASACQHLSEDFIRKHKDDVEWENISNYQKLSELFIKEFEDRVYWYYILYRQHLSEEYVADRIKSMNIHDSIVCVYVKSHKITERFAYELLRNSTSKELIECLYLYQQFGKKYEHDVRPGIVRDNWMDESTEFKKKAVVDTGLYECYDDYFIAYKGIRSDRFSCHDFNYQYLPGQTYEAWCDCTSTENSFGLSVWTEDEARNFCKELVIKVKVRYEDVGRVVHNGGKIRCFKFEVLD